MRSQFPLNKLNATYSKTSPNDHLKIKTTSILRPLWSSPLGGLTRDILL